MNSIKSKFIENVNIDNIESIKRGHYKEYGNICVIIFRCDWLDCCYNEYCEVARKIGLPVI